MNPKDLLTDPQSRRPRRAAYALPTLFTAGNVFFGFYAILQTFQGAMAANSGAEAAAEAFFRIAALSIGLAVFLDGLDGRIARMTNTTSEFGRELDSLADVITFGIAPAVLAFAWGIQFIAPSDDPSILSDLRHAGYFFSFLFLLCGAMRLARFNITTNPVLKNPGRPDKKYFAGLAIPSGAAPIAAIVYAANGVPLRWWPYAVMWLLLLLCLSFLMVSTWRYPSFKDLNLSRPRSPLTFVVVGGAIYLTYLYSRWALLGFAVTYMMSGIVIRIGGIIRRRFRG